jgi:hypothetical protein
MLTLCVSNLLCISPLWCASALAATAIPYSSVSDLVRSGRVVFASQPTAGEYRLVLSSIKKVNNQWRGIEKLIPRASVSRMTVELDELIPYGDVKRRLEKDMATATEFSLLFQCSGLDCGSSNGWANEFLRVKQLYGMDTNQFYAVSTTREPAGAEIYLVWYLVQRGNGRIYLQQDLVRIADGEVALSPEPWSERLEQLGFFVLPGLSLDGAEPKIADSSIELLLELLRQNPSRVLRLVGHDYSAGSITERGRKSLFYAQWLRDRLIERKVAPERLTAHGVASLAPAGRQGEARIEVVRD